MEAALDARGRFMRDNLISRLGEWRSALLNEKVARHRPKKVEEVERPRRAQPHPLYLRMNAAVKLCLERKFAKQFLKAGWESVRFEELQFEEEELDTALETFLRAEEAESGDGE